MNQVSILNQHDTYTISTITIDPNFSYSYTLTNKKQFKVATHLTILEGKNILLTVEKEVFDQVEVGEVFHIHPNEYYTIQNKDELVDCVILQVQIKSVNEESDTEVDTKVDTEVNKQESSPLKDEIDFSKISLRSFRLIGWEDLEESDDLIFSHNDSKDNNKEEEEFKCKYC